MAHLVLLLAVTAIVPTAAGETVWSSVAFLLYGERTPLQGPNAPQLTPIGAQQMYGQGSVFRARYLDSTNTTDDMNSVTTQAFIQGIESDSLDNSQVISLSTDDSYVAASALAFLQGLYPPQTRDFASGNGGRDAAVLADNTRYNFPLDGYQYPLVATFSEADSTSPWIEGQAACSTYQQSIMNLRDETYAQDINNETLDFYESLWVGVFQGAFSKSSVNYYNAYKLYDYASYEYDHNPQMANAMNESDITTLRALAFVQQLGLNGNLSVSGKEDGDMIRAISGRMLCKYVLHLLKQNFGANGDTNKLNLVFGSFEPFLAFFELTGLISSSTNNEFLTLPGPGAAMVWELFSNSDDTNVYPSENDLHVRFLYRPNAKNQTALTQYGLFGNESSEASMSFSEFSTYMNVIGIDGLTQWCKTCDAISLFCSALEENSDGIGSSSSGSSKSKSKMTPVLGGVIGAMVTLAVVSLVGLAAMLLCRVRLYRVGPGGAGGFKGAEKKPGDLDVTVSETGARHERVGSWELHGNSNGQKAYESASPLRQPMSAGDITDERRVESNIKDAYDDDDDEVGLTGPPVMPKEHV